MTEEKQKMSNGVNNQEQPASSADKQPVTPQQPQQKPASPAGRPKWLIPVIVIVGVIILGFAAWGGYELFKPTPSKLPEGGEAAEDEFKDWKTYQNEEYGFEMRYPSTMTVVDEVSNIYGMNKPFLVLNIGEKDYIRNLNREGGPGLLPDSIDNAGFTIFAYNISIHGLDESVAGIYRNFKQSGMMDFDGVKVNIYEGNFDLPEGIIPAMYIRFLNKDNSIRYFISSIFYSAEDENLVNQILSTFKFIEPINKQETIIPPEEICLDNGGEFLIRDGAPLCVFSDGKECGEFGYNKCVESKGNWQPISAPPSGMD